MKLLFDFFPIILFFVAYKFQGIYVATMVAIAATFIQVGLVWIKHRRVEPMHLVTLVLIAVFGGATLYLHDEQFIKWKPTVINWLFGVAFLASQFFGKAPFIQRMMGGNVELPQPVWYKLNLSWALFFIFLGAVNLFVIYNFNTDIWVNFKLFGMLGLTFAFVLLQAVFLSRYMPEPESSTKE
ncbi:MAG: septation protein A [Methylothermaceae bacteria B42]|nr:MAG: septation protein A [Methylothermaceae bacteria B42]HHJ39057.1 septation protein A [Methylothermaceae bacterium]